MKISDFIFKFKSYTMREEGLCRIRFFVNNQMENFCVITDIGIMSNAPCLDNVCSTVISKLIGSGYWTQSKYFILHSDYDNSMKVVDISGTIKKILTKKEVEILTECEKSEFSYKSWDIIAVKKQIKKVRYEIDPFIDSQNLELPEYYKREIEIKENAVSKKCLKQLIDSGATERELANLIKQDLSLIGEIYGRYNEYIAFSEFPIGDKRVDFAVFSSRSKMNVTFIEIKGANFNLKNQGPYDNLNAKIEEANSQIRNHRKYIYDNYNTFKREMHRIRENAESGKKIYNAFLSPVGKLLVDANKNIDIRFVIVAGRTPKDDIEESDLRYQFGKSNQDVELFSWDSWLVRIDRD